MRNAFLFLFLFCASAVAQTAPALLNVGKSDLWVPPVAVDMNRADDCKGCWPVVSIAVDFVGIGGTLYPDQPRFSFLHNNGPSARVGFLWIGTNPLLTNPGHCFIDDEDELCYGTTCAADLVFYGQDHSQGIQIPDIEAIHNRNGHWEDVPVGSAGSDGTTFNYDMQALCGGDIEPFDIRVFVRRDHDGDPSTPRVPQHWATINVEFVCTECR